VVDGLFEAIVTRNLFQETEMDRYANLLISRGNGNLVSSKLAQLLAEAGSPEAVHPAQKILGFSYLEKWGSGDQVIVLSDYADDQSHYVTRTKKGKQPWRDSGPSTFGQWAAFIVQLRSGR
jgi:hypothetical protein